MWSNEQHSCLVGQHKTIMINQQPCSYTVEHVVREWWNNKIEQRCYNNNHACTWLLYIKSGFACSNICEETLSIHQAPYNICWNMIEQYCFLPILFCHVNSVVTGLLSQQPCNSLWYFYACIRELKQVTFENHGRHIISIESLCLNKDN